MKKFLLDIFPRIVTYSKKLDDLSVLVNKPWVMMTEDSTVREVWIFRKGGDLIISRDGVVLKGEWDYIKEAKSIYVEAGNTKRLFNQAFADEIALLMKLDGDKEIFAFANQNKIVKNFKILKYLEKKLDELQPKEKISPHKKSITQPKPLPFKEPTIDELIADIRDYLNSLIFLMISFSVVIVILGILLIINNVLYIFLIVGGLLLIANIMFFRIYMSKRKELMVLLNKKNGEKAATPSSKRDIYGYFRKR